MPLREPKGRCTSKVAQRIAAIAVSLCAVCSLLDAQTDRLVRGRVHNGATRQPLRDVIVTPLGLRGVAHARSESDGRFTLRVPDGAVRVVAARLGFAPETVSVPRDSDTVSIALAPTALAIDPVLITAERSYSAASSSTVRELDIRLRPRDSSQELLRLTPGLVIAQHAGGGKAEQIFLRGFDADHGTDVAISADGTPVNMVTHAHGQGYADLHFLMPEVVEQVDVRKGPYDARDGDFATAGAVAFRTKDRIAAPLLAVRGGSFDTRHALTMLPLGGDAAHAGGYLAASLHRSDGPLDAPQDYRRFNAFAKWTAPVSRNAELVASASAFDTRWDASGQVPLRSVRARQIGRFGSIDPTEGGATQRYDVSAALRSRTSEAADWEARLYAARYRFGLFSNFTFFLADSVNGDGIEQVDDRAMLGATGTYGRPASLFGRAGWWQLGAGLRADLGDVALYSQRARERLAMRVDARSRQTHLFNWARYKLHLGDRVRLDVGIRGDLFRFDVTDRLVRDSSAELPHASGVRWRGIVSPKANLAMDLTHSTTLFVNAGTGFHSNDGRDVVLGGRRSRTLPRARAGELGARHTWSGGSIAASLWALDLDSELVYVGDEGVTEPSGRTRRIGVDIEGRVRLAPWLWADADLNFARGRFRDAPAGENRVPLAPTRTATAGLTVRDIGPAQGGLRLRHVASRPATEDGSITALGYTVWELFGSWRLARATLVFAVDNLFDTDWNEAQFATTSRLRGELTEVSELHFTPGAPRTVQAGLEYRF